MMKGGETMRPVYLVVFLDAVSQKLMCYEYNSLEEALNGILFLDADMTIDLRMYRSFRMDG